MDLDRFIVDRRSGWERLGELTRASARGVRRLGDDEVDELISRYQTTTADLTTAQSRIPDATLIAVLSRYVADARGVVYRDRVPARRAVVDFFTVRVPGAMWISRRLIAAAAVVFLGLSISVGVWIAQDDEARNIAMPPEAQDILVEQEFAQYYQSEAAANFASRVTTNNIQVAFVAYIGGATLGIGTLAILASNAISIGATAGIMHAHDAGGVFWGLITPHGLLEIASVLVAAGFGLHLGWSVIAPGPLLRRTSFARVARTSIDGVVGLMVTFVIAGLIEAFVTPSGAPTAMRVSIGVLALAAFVLYVVALGPAGATEIDRRRNERFTGDGATITTVPTP